MLRTLTAILAIAFALSFALPAAGAVAHKQRRVAKPHAARAAHGFGFLPGYRPPHVIERERRERFWVTGQVGRPYYAVPWARFHRGRWNGGGFGPCYTYTPIGPVWNCGR